MFGRINLFPMEAIAEIAVPFDGQVGCPQKLDEKPVLNLNKKKWLLLIFFCVKKQHQPTKNACSTLELSVRAMRFGS